jgi:phage terminase large subunit GpA-like protein
MILKRHRDTMFAKDPSNKPISIIISTLAAHAYQGEETIGYALLSIVSRMENAIDHDGQKYVVKNPTNALENFADKWEDYPERAEAFFSWLKKARGDFSSAGLLSEHRRISNVLANGLGRDLADEISEGVSLLGPGLMGAATAASVIAAPSVSFSDAPRTPKKPDGFA